MKIFIEVDVQQSGQPRPYADSEFVQVITFKMEDGRVKEWLDKNNQPYIIPHYVSEEKALAVARIFCPYVEKSDPKANWASRFLVSFQMLDPSPPAKDTFGVTKGFSDRWKIHVRSAFTD